MDRKAELGSWACPVSVLWVVQVSGCPHSLQGELTLLLPWLFLFHRQLEEKTLVFKEKLSSLGLSENPCVVAGAEDGGVRIGLSRHPVIGAGDVTLLCQRRFMLGTGDDFFTERVIRHH